MKQPRKASSVPTKKPNKKKTVQTVSAIATKKTTHVLSNKKTPEKKLRKPRVRQFVAQEKMDLAQIAVTVRNNEVNGLSYDGQAFDILLHDAIAHFTNCLFPTSYGLAMLDWLVHFVAAPAKQLDLTRKAAHKLLQLNFYQTQQTADLPCHARSGDTRFADTLWNCFPFNYYVQSFLMCEEWWNEATLNMRGVSQHHLQIVNFAARQMLDIFSPSNWPWTNPEIIQATYTLNGKNFLNGWQNFVEDYSRVMNYLPAVGTEQFKVGKTVAITPGKVIYRNPLIELIQYLPTTSKVYAEPILIVPAWIMKYYILDLSEHNSLVKYLVDKGHTVFMISWKNPDSHDRDLGMEDYINLGVMAALDAINQIVPQKKIHAVGYCIGGTLLMMAAAAMANQLDDRLQTITLFAAQVDFEEAGELTLFIDQSQISYLEDVMWQKGYLDGAQMAGAFSMLHSKDLVWSRIIHDYLLGERRPMNDLMAWNADTTRMPYRMHSEYLNKIFLHNDLSQGRYQINQKNIALLDVTTPIFAVSTVTDHVAPWKSVYKLHLYTPATVTFVLTNGGHNAGIVSEPNHPGRHYQIATRYAENKYIDAESWQANTPHTEGSWWPAWTDWLKECSGAKVNPPSMGNAKKNYVVLGDAPGTYVLQK